MLQFSAPIWLLAIAGILIPVLIHLWNRRPARIIKIGSTSLLKSEQIRKKRSRSISDYLLLFIRCLVFLLLALLLARPFLTAQPKSEKQRGWLLIAGIDLSEARLQYPKLIDSLIQSGYELRQMDAGFPVIPNSDIPAVQNKDLSYWKCFELADQLADPKIPFYIISSDKISGYRGQRPTSSRNLNWKLISNDSVIDWNQSAYLTGTDSLVIIRGQARSAYIRYNHDQRPATYKSISMVGLTDTTEMQIGLYADKKYAADLSFLAAGIKAVQRYTSRKMRVYYIDSAGSGSSLDWIFWLSDLPLPKANASHYFLYETGKTMDANSNAVVGDKKAFVTEFNVYKSIHPAEKAVGVNSIWKDGNGNALLTEEEKDKSRYFGFYSHFDPVWNSLVGSAAFPSFILSLLFAEKDSVKTAFDFPALERAQVQPIAIGAAKKPIAEKGTAAPNVKLAGYLWLLIFLLFIVERLLSFKKQAEFRRAAL